jgi:hypothetical protein
MEAPVTQCASEERRVSSNTAGQDASAHKMRKLFFREPLIHLLGWDCGCRGFPLFGLVGDHGLRGDEKAGHAPDQFGPTPLKLFLVIIAGGGFDLGLELFDAPLQDLAVATAADDGRVILYKMKSVARNLLL